MEAHANVGTYERRAFVEGLAVTPHRVFGLTHRSTRIAHQIVHFISRMYFYVRAHLLTKKAEKVNVPQS